MPSALLEGLEICSLGSYKYQITPLDGLVETTEEGSWVKKYTSTNGRGSRTRVEVLRIDLIT